MPNDIDLTDNNESKILIIKNFVNRKISALFVCLLLLKQVSEFLFPIERVDEKLKKKLANYDYELSREELNKMVKIVFDKMGSLNK